MTEPPVRSRLIQLRRDLDAARTGRELLDRKREAILRALSDRTPRRDAARARAVERLHDARAALDRAEIEIGRAAVAGAAAAQPVLDTLAIAESAIVGVAVPRVEGAVPPFTPCYGPGSAPASLDAAGAAFADALPAVMELASEATAVDRLRAALARTARRLNALDRLVLPTIADQIARVAAAIEEDERDESVRRRAWLERPGRTSSGSPVL
jgi:V/A-type H+-transporting ATPase subunit D